MIENDAAVSTDERIIIANERPRPCDERRGHDRPMIVNGNAPPGCTKNACWCTATSPPLTFTVRALVRRLDNLRGGCTLVQLRDHVEAEDTMRDEDPDDGFLHAGNRYLISDWDLDQLGELLNEWEDRETNLARIKRVTESTLATLETRRAA